MGQYLVKMKNTLQLNAAEVLQRKKKCQQWQQQKNMITRETGIFIETEK